MALSVKEDRKSFYKYVSNTRRTKENLCPYMDSEGNIVVKDNEKPEVLNTFSSLLDAHPPELDGRDGEQNEVP